MTQPYPAPEADTQRAHLRYIRGIDGLRAISVLAVLVYHHYVVGGSSPGWLPGGFYGVEVFFVLSGYLITSLLLDERTRTGTIALKAFWFRRARRLLPALFLMLSVVVLFSLVFLRDNAISELKSDAVAAMTYTSNWWQIIAEPLVLRDGGPTGTAAAPLVARDRGAVLPVLAVGARRRAEEARPRSRAVGDDRRRAALGRARWRCSTRSASATRTSTTRHRRACRACCSAPRSRSGGHRAACAARPASTRAWCSIVGGVVGLYLLWWSFRGTHDYDAIAFRGGFLIVDVATLLVIASVVHPRGDVNKVLGIPVLVWIGLRSYGIYLWHFPIFAVTRHGRPR